jgi:SnoaL-like domain
MTPNRITLDVHDRIALADVVHSYAAAVDDRRLDDAAQLFVDTGELALPDPPHFLEPIHHHKGRSAIRSALASVASLLRTQHAIVGEVYRAGAGADEAYGRIACVAHHWSRRGDDLTDLAWHTEYGDRYVRTPSGWRIASRALTINAIESRPVRRVR